MAGHFEIIDAPDGGFRVRLLDGAGTPGGGLGDVPHQAGCRCRDFLTREIAGTGLIRDMSRGGHGEVIIPKSRPPKQP